MSDLFEPPNTTVWDLRHGDCLAGMAALPSESVDVVVTSPPYNLNIGYRSYADDSPRAEYLNWCAQWAEQIKRLLKPEGSFFLNVGASPANPLLPHELVLKLQPYFTLQNTLHWIKSITVQPRREPELSVGHFKPINSKRFITDCHEYLFHLTRSGNVQLDRLAVGVEYSDKSNVTRWGHTEGRDRRCRGNNWFIPYETINSRDKNRPHPATFPVQLAEQCIRLHGVRPGLTMMDPFLGIGHSALAAKACSVSRFIGFEIDAGYYQEACERLEVPCSVEASP
ncbi:MAG: Methyltransferase [Chthoniobacteraceae bacterium]|nr:Methyltransferase [Chthoniobacteraceae bacterium]